MDQEQSINNVTPSAPLVTPPHRRGGGAIIGLLIAVIVIAAIVILIVKRGDMGKGENTQSMTEEVSQNSSETAATGEVTLSSSDEVPALESDLENIDVDGLDSDLENLE